jgi:FkbM family methyltransferase
MLAGPTGTMGTLKQRIPFAVRHRLRQVSDRISAAPAQAARRAADADDPMSRAYYDWYLRRRFGPLRALLPADPLVFDVGANVGAWTGVLRSMGCRVVAVEPQADCIDRLQMRFAGDPRVTIVAAAIGGETGDIELFVAAGSEHATTSRKWMDDMVARGGFQPSYWEQIVTVATRTLDDLIQEFGEPHYLKLDIEGSEPTALHGLSHAPPLVSFETHGETLDDAAACIEQLAKLGRYEFNLTPGDFPTPLWTEWVDGEELVSTLQTQRHGWHNVLARRRVA